MTENEIKLIERIKEIYPEGLDAIVVEGYDGVGKGRLLNTLSDYYEVVPYRPDYNLWQQFDHRKVDRWKISGFFWDVFSHFHNSSGANAMLFDRGVLSGAVYNNDMTIADNYKSMLRDMKVLHILVECTEEDFTHFSLLRNSNNTISDIQIEYDKYFYYTCRYHEALTRSGVDYITYWNEYDTSIASDSVDSCIGCGHYNHGICRHPKINREVEGSGYRCSYSTDKEVQDYGTEMYSL